MFVGVLYLCGLKAKASFKTLTLPQWEIITNLRQFELGQLFSPCKYMKPSSKFISRDFLTAFP
jgi:hypothetical protein